VYRLRAALRGDQQATNAFMLAREGIVAAPPALR
jgi:hypothetical protein